MSTSFDSVNQSFLTYKVSHQKMSNHFWKEDSYLTHSWDLSFVDLIFKPIHSSVKINYLWVITVVLSFVSQGRVTEIGSALWIHCLTVLWIPLNKEYIPLRCIPTWDLLICLRAMQYFRVCYTSCTPWMVMTVFPPLAGFLLFQVVCFGALVFGGFV